MGKKCIVAALLSISLITYQIELLLKCLLAIFCLFLKYLYIYVLRLLFEGCLPFCGIIYSYYHSFLLYAHIFSPIHCLSFNLDSFLKILLISIVKCLPYIYDCFLTFMSVINIKFNFLHGAKTLSLSSTKWMPFALPVP